MANKKSRIILAVSAVSPLANSARIEDMSDLSAKYDRYCRRLREAMDARKMNNEELADRVGAHAVTISKLRTGKIALDDEWRARVAEALAMNADVLFGSAPLPAPAPHEILTPRRRGRKPANDNTTLKVYGYAAGAQFGHRNGQSQTHDEVPRPPGLKGVESAYALRTRNDSMVPRYFPEEILFVNPELPLKPGDHIIIQAQLHGDDELETWVKRFDAMTNDEVFVTQYNPVARMVFKRKYVRYMHRVLTPNELFPNL